MRKNNHKKFKKDIQPRRTRSGRLVAAATRAILAVAFVAGLVFILFYAARKVYVADPFRVKTVRANVELEPDLKNAIVGRSLFGLDIAEIHGRISHRHPEYKSVCVVKDFPSTLRVEVKKRLALAQIKDDMFFPIDGEGVVMADGSNAPYAQLIPVELDLPLRGLRKGLRICDARIEPALRLVREIGRRRLQRKFKVTMINANSLPAIYFVIDKPLAEDENESQGVEVIVGQDEFAHKLAILEKLIQEEFKDDITALKYVDLRYKKPVLGILR